MTESLWPGDCPATVECSECGESWELESSYGWTYTEEAGPDDGKKYHDSSLPTYDIPTSKRRKYIVFCPCGRRLADILDPHWPSGASGGYVEDPPDDRM